MVTRTGKIARLPHNIREQINDRLLDGHSALSILPWLNDLPEVQAILQAQFDSQPISAVNLTAWRAGGYRDWLLRQQALELIQNLDADEHASAQSLARPLSGKLARWVALHFAALAHSIISSQENQDIKWARLRELCADISRLRHGDHQAERLSLDREWLALETSNSLAQRETEFWKWTERPDIQKKLFPDKEGGLSPETLEKIERELRLL